MWLKSSWLLCAAIALIAAGCSKSPGIKYRDGDVTIAYLKSLYERTAVTVEGDVYVTGRVVSTDQYGNFYKTLVIEDATGGILLRIDLENYHRTYFPGMQVRVACNSLVLSSYGGTLQIGAYSREDGVPDPGYIPEERLAAVITINEGLDETPIPLRFGIDGLAPEHIGRLVSFDGVQFVDAELGLTWSEPDVNTDRHVVDRSGNTLAVRTSRYAGFAARLLPRGSGYIQGIATWFNGKYQLEVCSDIYAVMTSPRF